jgi:Flp pilus assembly pilin Flp
MTFSELRELISLYARREEGQTMAEYGIVLAVVTIAAVGVFTALSGGIQGAINRVTSLLPSEGRRTNKRRGWVLAAEDPPPLHATDERTGMRFGGLKPRCERGQTMAEFAVVLPVLVLVLFAIMQFGIVFNNYVTLTDAVRAGARKGAVSRRQSNPSGLTAQRVRDSASTLNQSQLTINVSSSWAAGSDLTVTATYPYSISLFGLVVKSGRLNTTVVERVE